MNGCMHMDALQSGMAEPLTDNALQDNDGRNAQINTHMAQAVMGNCAADACQILFLLVLCIKSFPVQGVAPL